MRYIYAKGLKSFDFGRVINSICMKNLVRIGMIAWADLHRLSGLGHLSNSDHLSDLTVWVVLTAWVVLFYFKNQLIKKTFNLRKDTDSLYTSNEPNMPQAKPL